MSARIEIDGVDVTEHVRWEAITLAFDDFGRAARRAGEQMTSFAIAFQAAFARPRRQRTGHRHRGTAAWARRYRSARPGVPLGQRARG